MATNAPLSSKLLLFKIDKNLTDDYIKNPKPNGYKSIHTIIDIGQQDYVEVQIKTEKMHTFNEYGGASHSYYKLYGVEKPEQAKLDFLKSIVLWKDSLTDSSKSFELLNTDILTFTPKGEVIELPKDSIPIDFAYSVHSRVGEEAVSARVNGKMVSLTYTLNSGDLVEIVTTKNFKRLNYYDLLKSVKTKEAQMAIKRKMRASSK
jgi:GTP pyrophosphokinase